MTDDLLFSVVVPTRNRPRPLTHLLESLGHLEMPKSAFEVIVVDDGGSTPIEKIVSQYRNRLQLDLLRVQWGGPARSRQLGTQHARGHYLAFIDDDCVPASEWLNVHLRMLEAMPGCAVGGSVVNSSVDNLFAHASQLVITYCFQHFNRDAHDGRFFTTNNLVFPREAFLAIGGMDSEWTIDGGEDRDVCDRWRFHGRKICYAPDAVVYHAQRLCFTGFLYQQFRYGQGSYQYHHRRAMRRRAGFQLEPAGFYLGLPFAPFGEEPWHRALAIAGLLVISQAADLAGYLWRSFLYRVGRR